MLPSTAADLRRANLSRAVRAVHAGPQQLTRADLGRLLGCTRGTLGVLVADLDALGLVEETPAPGTGRRGRPSAYLTPASGGPTVLALEIATDRLRLASAALGGQLIDLEEQPILDQEATPVLAAAGAMIRRRLDPRCAGLGIAMHGLVERSTATVASAPGLNWAGVDVLGRLALPADRRTRIDNVATLSALGESVRGRGRRRGTMLYLHADVGLGGALTLDGVPAPGRNGFAGEYGHLPFGRRNVLCRCGLRGCWETEVDQLALARAVGLVVGPETAATAAAAVFRRAADGDPLARAGVHQVAADLGRGIGALVSVHDPDLVVLSGHAADLLTADAMIVETAAREGSLAVHRADMPPIEAGRLGRDSALIGAVEAVFDDLIDEFVPLTEPWGIA